MGKDIEPKWGEYWTFADRVDPSKKDEPWLRKVDSGARTLSAAQEYVNNRRGRNRLGQLEIIGPKKTYESNISLDNVKRYGSPDIIVFTSERYAVIVNCNDELVNKIF